jgi:hypothetical protein
LPKKQKGDTIKFANNKGQKIYFVLNEVSITDQPYQINCKGDGFLGCYCDECNPIASIKADASHTIANQSVYRMSVTDYGNSSQRIESQVYDFSIRSIYENYGATPEKIDSVHFSYRLGNVLYSKIHVVSMDTTRANSPKVWKAYLATTSEIVGFWDRTSNTLFYKE